MNSPLRPCWSLFLNVAAAEWEVRIERFRVFYDADGNQEIVEVKVVGQKLGSKVFVRGKEFKL
jgi:hypothetical protein